MKPNDTIFQQAIVPFHLIATLVAFQARWPIASRTHVRTVISFTNARGPLVEQEANALELPLVENHGEPSTPPNIHIHD